MGDSGKIRRSFLFLNTVKMAFSVEQKMSHFDTENNKKIDFKGYFLVLTKTKKSKISLIPRPRCRPWRALSGSTFLI